MQRSETLRWPSAGGTTLVLGFKCVFFGGAFRGVESLIIGGSLGSKRA